RGKNTKNTCALASLAQTDISRFGCQPLASVSISTKASAAISGAPTLAISGHVKRNHSQIAHEAANTSITVKGHTAGMDIATTRVAIRTIAVIIRCLSIDAPLGIEC